MADISPNKTARMQLALTHPSFTPRDIAFDSAQIERLRILENDFLAVFGTTEINMDRKRNQLLLSAVIFGGLLNSKEWSNWVSAVMEKLKILPHQKRLNADETRSVYIAATSRLWFADPMTQNLLGRQMRNNDFERLQVDAPTSERNDYARLIGLSEPLLFAELKAWLLPALRTVMGLAWPPIIVEHCSGLLGSKSLSEIRWRQLHKPERIADSKFPAAPLEPIRRERPTAEFKNMSGFWLKDRGFAYIEKAIFDTIQDFAASADPKLSIERKILKEKLENSQSMHATFTEPEGSLGWWVHEWFLQHCPVSQSGQDKKPSRHLRARTLYNYVFLLGLRVDWSDLWGVPLEDISADTLKDKLFEVVRERPDAFYIAKRLNSFLGFTTLPRHQDVKETKPQPAIKVQILTALEFKAAQEELRDCNGQAGAHCLAAVLMFRCGLRTREVIALEIDHVTVVNDIVELNVVATPYVNLKNKTSRRVLPLHALLLPEELAELLKWRARRIRECHEARRHMRLLFGTIFHPSDYDYLLDPIEAAVRKACNHPPPGTEEKKLPAYIFGRCSSLRHSFVSYALASLLMPRDAGGFTMPSGITPDLVSLERRDRLERDLLAQGHLGLSTIEALRQLVGHSHFRRTLGTYSHLMDLTAGAYSWRRSIEPCLPASQLEALVDGQTKMETLIRNAATATEREQADFETAVLALRNCDKVVTLFSPRARRRRSKKVASWEPTGNVFLSQLRPLPAPSTTEGIGEIPEWRTDDISDWRTIDLIVQMASRCMPAILIADEVGIRPEVITRLTSRYHQLLSLRKRATASGKGQLRHIIALNDRVGGDTLGTFYPDDGCWYGPLKRLPPDREEGLDKIWHQLLVRRKERMNLALIRAFVRTHQGGRIQHRKKERLLAIQAELNALLAGVKPPFAEAEMRSYKHEDGSLIHELRLSPKKAQSLAVLNSEEAKRSDFTQSAVAVILCKPALRGKPAHWPASAAMLHLMLMAEAASTRKLPKSLVFGSRARASADVQGDISRWRAQKETKRIELEEAIRQSRIAAERQVIEAAHKAKRMARLNSRPSRMRPRRVFKRP